MLEDKISWNVLKILAWAFICEEFVELAEDVSSKVNKYSLTNEYKNIL